MRGGRGRHRPDEKRHSEPSVEVIYGRWPVREALEAGPVFKIFLADNAGGDPIDEILKLAKVKDVICHRVDQGRLDQMVGSDAVHQGVAALVSPAALTDIDEVWGIAKRSRTRGPCVLFLDGITDPQNLGSILRCAVFFGIPAVVIPKWRAASLTGAVVRASAGAARLIPIAQVSNLATAMEAARKQGIWLVGADMGGQDVKKVDLPRPFGLVLGSEGEGLHQLVREKCEVLVSIARPEGIRGLGSLNVGVATGILIHQFS